jgi:hypothetical protein
VSPIAISLVAFAIILGGAFAGTLLRKALPGDHLADDAKDIIRLGAGLIGTIAALVLGLHQPKVRTTPRVVTCSI